MDKVMTVAELEQKARECKVDIAWVARRAPFQNVKVVVVEGKDIYTEDLSEYLGNCIVW